MLMAANHIAMATVAVWLTYSLDTGCLKMPNSLNNGRIKNKNRWKCS